MTKVDSVMPEADSVKQKLILGAMKKLKSIDCQTMSTIVGKDASAHIEELKSYGFKVKSTDDDTMELVANLAALNPDPQRKIE